RISVGEHALQTTLGLGERFLKVAQLLPEAEADMVRQPEVVARDEQYAVIGPHLLHQVEGADRLAVAHEANRPRLRGVPAERVAEPLQPLLDHRVVRAEDSARARAATRRPPPRDSRSPVASPSTARVPPDCADW